MIVYKEGVDPVGLHWRMRRVLKTAESVWERYSRELVVTATVEDGHGKWSWHPFGCAVDLRTKYFPSDEVAKAACDELRRKLGAPYQVIFHATTFTRPSHCHVEADMVAYGLDKE